MGWGEQCNILQHTRDNELVFRLEIGAIVRMLGHQLCQICMLIPGMATGTRSCISATSSHKYQHDVLQGFLALTEIRK